MGRPEDQGVREEWRACPDYPSYEVSSLGRVRSHYRSPPQVLAQSTDRTGYNMIPLTHEGKRTSKAVHRLVCRAFHGESKPPHREAAHLNSDRNDNRACNLKWVGKVQNHHHKRLHGTHQAGEKHPRAKITAAEVLVIKCRLQAGESCARIAADYPVSPSAIYDIKRGKNWK